MPSRRDMIAMAPDELANYLAQQRRIILISNGKDGLPHPVPMNYGIDGDGRIVIATFRKSQKVKNLERDPRATLLAESGESYHELKSAILYCDAEILRDPRDVAAAMAHIRADNVMKGSLSPAMSEQVRATMAKRVVLRFTPFKVVSWDHRKLGGVY
jgi:nitroimidazol reductase NimA-like FMN-containing flavoprotein (pyridoxamine 5'-phosphate oxidase superfamily)